MQSLESITHAVGRQDLPQICVHVSCNGEAELGVEIIYEAQELEYRFDRCQTLACTLRIGAACIPHERSALVRPLWTVAGKSISLPVSSSKHYNSLLCRDHMVGASLSPARSFSKSSSAFSTSLPRLVRISIDQRQKGYLSHGVCVKGSKPQQLCYLHSGRNYLIGS